MAFVSASAGYRLPPSQLEAVRTVFVAGIVQVDGVAVPTALTPGQVRRAKREIIRCNTHRNALRAKLSRAIRDNDLLAQDTAIFHLVSGPECIVSYTVEANKELPFSKRHPLEECIEVPPSFTIEAPLEETVLAWAEPKAKAGFRTLVSFDLRHKAMQLAVKDILSRYFVPRSFQYAHRGVHAAIRGVRDQLEACAGHTCFEHYDIKNFYGSFDEELSGRLPVPKGAADNVVLGRHLNVQVNMKRAKANHYGHPLYPSASTIIGDARLGIPTGSICSPMVGNWVVSHLAWKGEGVALFTYVDNFLFLGSSPQEAAEAAGRAVEAVGKLPGGNFILERRDHGLVTEEFEFLGHAIRKGPSGVRVRPSDVSVASLGMRFDELDKVLSGSTRPEALKKLVRMTALIDGWASAFSSCDDVERELFTYRQCRKEWMKYYKASEMEIADVSKDHPATFDLDFSAVVVPSGSVAKAA